MDDKIKVFISIVSHKQEELIIKNFKNLDLESKKYTIKICLIDNTNSIKLKEFANEKNHIYFLNNKIKGFGENHNNAFKLTNANNDDLFIVCNPDIILEKEQLIGMLDYFIEKNLQIGNVSCYYNKEKTILSNPDRYFPCFLNFLFSLLLGKRFHYGTNTNVNNPEWISGEFMITKASVYKEINGFDEKYFLYVEDIDFCYRARKANIPISHNKNHYIIHETQMASRNIFSKNFIMHFSSVFRFLKNHKILCFIKKAP
ncbi:MAG: glycosyltransferase family 2 protein [Aliarcobacter sp.]|nr:glycosyltransferase family 2 protein [Aliarcobacter sp.]